MRVRKFARFWRIPKESTGVNVANVQRIGWADPGMEKSAGFHKMEVVKKRNQELRLPAEVVLRTDDSLSAFAHSWNDRQGLVIGNRDGDCDGKAGRCKASC